MSAYRLMKVATLIELKDIIEDNLLCYESFDNKEILDKLGVNEVEFDNTLKVSDLKDKSRDDLENAIRLYEEYKDIPLSLASDELFWSYLTHTCFWHYMCQRWPIGEAQGDKVNFIKTRYFFGKASFYRNGLSRLWWYAYLTYDSLKEDPYYYTSLMLRNQDLANLMIDSTNLSRNKVALKAILEVVTDIERLENSGEIDKIKNKRLLIRGLAKYVNLIGGVTIWDALSEQEAYDKAWQYIEKTLKVEKVFAY